MTDGQTSILGPLELVTPPTGLAVARVEAKLQCKVDPDITEDDGLIDGLIEAAQEYCETATPGHRQLVSATYDVRLSEFPERVKLPRPPLQSLTSLNYYDTDGNETTLASTYYVVRTPLRQPGVIERAPVQVWPVTETDRQYPVRARFVCGYGPSTSIALAVSSGSQTVTPGTMTGIYAGTKLVIDTGTDQETVAVASVTATTFTATFAKSHAAGVLVMPGVPRPVRHAILMWVASSYAFRGDQGPDEKAMQAIENMLMNAAGWGSYA